MKIKRITKKHFRGSVYNFETEEDQSYVVNGIVVHNCRCTVTAVSKYEVEDYGIKPGENWGFDKDGNWSKIGQAPRGGEYSPDEGFTGNPANGEWFKKWADKKGVDLEKIKNRYM